MNSEFGKKASKPRFVGKVSEERVAARQASSCRKRALENVGRVQIGRTRGCRIGSAGATPYEKKLAALGPVGCIAKEIETEQWVIIKNSVGRAEHCFAVTMRIPCDADSRLKIVFVGVDALL